MELVVPEVVWKPELTSHPTKVGLRSMVDAWLKSFLDVGLLMKRLESGQGTQQCYTLYCNDKVSKPKYLTVCLVVELDLTAFALQCATKN